MNAAADVPVVVGLACRYPDAPSPDALWHTVLTGRRAFRAMPEQRLSGAYLGDGPDQTYLRQAAVLEDWTFDRRRFQVPPHVHSACDPSHWLALETAAAALADAGLGNGSGFDKRRVAVIVGNTLTGEFSRTAQIRHRLPFLKRLVSDALHSAGADAQLRDRTLTELSTRVLDTFTEPNEESLAGALSNTIAGRICNHFDFGGGGYTVDGACASSLLAITTGCRLLATGEADVVLAGGVDLSLDPLELVGFARLGALASNDMRVFDANPTGFLPGEGCGMVVLMRAADAGAHSLRPYAEVAGWGVSSDGSGGITRPEADGQARAIAAAYAMTRLEPGDVRLIEGHGTGTAVGDAVELAALNRIRGTAPAALGSIKANIGHTKAAAGAASFIKAVLAVHRRILPPATGVQTPHPLLDPDISGLKLLSEPAAWPDGPAHAGISSAGFGGINSHVLISGRATEVTGPRRPAAPRWQARPRPRPGFELLPLRAHSQDELGRLLSLVHERAEQWSAAEFVDVANTCAQTYSGLSGARAVLIARTPDEAATAAAKALTRLGDLWTGSRSPLIDDAAGFVLAAGRTPRLGLLFPGQAAPVRTGLSSWAGELAVPDFSPALEIHDGARGTEQAQPAIMRQSLAALEWLERMGVVAEAATGHSLGDLAALCWAGAIEPAAALRLAERRGQIMAAHGRAGTGMTSVRADTSTVTALLDGIDASIACHNGPLHTVIAGPLTALEEFQSRATARGIGCTPLNVSHAFHTEAMRPAVEHLEACLREVRWSEPNGVVISSVTGAPLPPEEDLARLLSRQLLRPVAFSAALRQLADRCDLLLEVGPGTTLQGLAAECADLPVLSCDAGGSERTAAVTAATLAAGGWASLRDWRGQRWFRLRTVEQTTSFLVNPCEADQHLPSVSAAVAPAALLTPTAPAVERPAPAASDAPRPAGPDTLTELRTLFARRADVAPHTLDSESSPLRDLHMSSLEVRRCIATVCAQRQVVTPDSALSLSDATLAQIAEVIDGLPGLDGRTRSARVDGVRRWLEPFEHRWEPWEPVPLPAGGAATVLDLPAQAGLAGLAARLPAALAHPGQPLVLRHIGHPGAAALGRGLALELPGAAVTVLDESVRGWPGEVADLAAADGYAELRVTPSGALERRVTRRRDRRAAAPLNFAGTDIILVTGGAAGLTARCAAELAARRGGRLVVLGRSPASAPAVTESLERLRSLGAELDDKQRLDYEQCDLTEPGAVRSLVSRLRAEGEITGLVHGAAVNLPRLLPAVTADSLAAAWAPKVEGARELLEATGDTLRLVVGFGSIIGCFGLAGETDYAVANEGMRQLLESWAAAHPVARVRVLEWSVWAELGMGARMQVLDDLRRAGVEPILPAEGIEEFLRLVDEADPPVTTLVASRFPPTATATVLGPAVDVADRTGRFVEDVRVQTPGVEIVTDSRLTYGDDLYLRDHQIDGASVLPAVLGLEAFAQLGATLGLPAGPLSFEDLSLTAPVDVADSGSTVLRVAALRVAGEPGTSGMRIDAVARSEADGFASDRIAATLRPAAALGTTAPADAPAGLDPAGVHSLYGSTLFHGGGLRRVGRYDLLSAYRVRAWIRADPHAKWFSSFHSSRIRLWDPGLLDAAMHVLLPTVPSRLALPVGCDRLEVAQPPEGWLHVAATELSHTEDEYVFDVTVSAPSGAVVCRWSGLRLRAVASRAFSDGLPLELVGPWLSRRAENARLGRIDIVTGPGRRADADATAMLAALSGGPVEHDAQGRPRSATGQLSASYAGGAVLAGFAPVAFGLDWQRPLDIPATDWPGCLTAADRALIGPLSRDLDESEAVVSTRIWCAREAIRKATGVDGALVLDGVRPNGDCLFSSGPARVLTAGVPIAGIGEMICGVAGIAGIAGPGHDGR
ncbi:MAG TPA: SDR family NAD(P)-dependent oxidoreductase [Jatrophihabitans sp.]|jgi:enediyne polyketide synthase|uniref:SDR family NAD(P)-dependent oxidoreductase n=1 Tax=Jatrophihabitans sp. TaxID=1932789 RepID=UPI002EF946B3